METVSIALGCRSLSHAFVKHTPTFLGTWRCRCRGKTEHVPSHASALCMRASLVEWPCNSGMEHSAKMVLTFAGNGPLGTAGVGSGNNDGGSADPSHASNVHLLPFGCMQLAPTCTCTQEKRYICRRDRLTIKPFCACRYSCVPDRLSVHPEGQPQRQWERPRVRFSHDDRLLMSSDCSRL